MLRIGENMSTLFDAQEARDVAIRQVEAAAPGEWMRRARDAALLVSLARFDFTTDDVWTALDGLEPPEPRAMGAVMKGLAAEGLIRATGEYRKSVRVECHARPVAVWRMVL
jgi:hypothetical protein